MEDIMNGSIRQISEDVQDNTASPCRKNRIYPVGKVNSANGEKGLI